MNTQSFPSYGTFPLSMFIIIVSMECMEISSIAIQGQWNYPILYFATNKVSNLAPRNQHLFYNDSLFYLVLYWAY